MGDQFLASPFPARLWLALLSGLGHLTVPLKTVASMTRLAVPLCFSSVVGHISGFDCL